MTTIGYKPDDLVKQLAAELAVKVAKEKEGRRQTNEI